MEKGKVECLGMTFDSEDARRAYFIERLREKLADPEFRKTPGFPKGADEDIIRMSDPPWYTACPNPFLADFVRVYGKPYDPQERYERDPFAVDTSVGKTDALYKAHGYHTKVPHLAIVPSILHYTEPGDIVLDGFAGSGMTGVAAQWCGSAPAEYRKQLEAEWSKQGLPKPKWGARRSILNDLGPAATFIAANYTVPFDVAAFSRAAQRILAEVEKELGWMYETLHSDGKTKGRINFTVWSEVFTCPECAGEVNFVEEALDPSTRNVSMTVFLVRIAMQSSQRVAWNELYETSGRSGHWKDHQDTQAASGLDRLLIGSARYEKVPTSDDAAILEKIAVMHLPTRGANARIALMHMYSRARCLDAAGVHTYPSLLLTSRCACPRGSLAPRHRRERCPSTRTCCCSSSSRRSGECRYSIGIARSHFSQVNRASQWSLLRCVTVVRSAVHGTS